MHIIAGGIAPGTQSQSIPDPERVAPLTDGYDPFRVAHRWLGLQPGAMPPAIKWVAFSDLRDFSNSF